MPHPLHTNAFEEMEITMNNTHIHLSSFIEIKKSTSLNTFLNNVLTLYING